jgi:hypothetical protein
MKRQSEAAVSAWNYAPDVMSVLLLWTALMRLGGRCGSVAGHGWAGHSMALCSPMSSKRRVMSSTSGRYSAQSALPVPRANAARPPTGTRMPAAQADALVLRYGLDGGPERSYREIGRQLAVSGHTARAFVERAQTQMRHLLD